MQFQFHKLCKHLIPYQQQLLVYLYQRFSKTALMLKAGLSVGTRNVWGKLYYLVLCQVSDLCLWQVCFVDLYRNHEHGHVCIVRGGRAWWRRGVRKKSVKETKWAPFISHMVSDSKSYVHLQNEFHARWLNTYHTRF